MYPRRELIATSLAYFHTYFWTSILETSAATNFYYRWPFGQKAHIIHDTRETHQPAPVVLPTRTMVKVSDRMRLIRQGDHRELAVLEAAVKKVCTPDQI